jgi:hypothetical protein
VNRTDEGALAWALADSASKFLDPVKRAWMCAKIGAGEHGNAIRELLALYANTRSELPCELATPLQAWIRGYAGSESEPILQHMYDRISVSVEKAASRELAEAELDCSPQRLTAKRSEPAACIAAVRRSTHFR